MADNFYLSVWFPTFTTGEMLPRALTLLRQFPFSKTLPGVGYLAVRAVAWSEPLVYSETFDQRADAEHALHLAAEFLHEDNAYEFEAAWDLWVPGEQYDTWRTEPRPVLFRVHGVEFEEGAYREDGHIQMDFGPDTPFLYEDLELTEIGQQRVQANLHKLVMFTAAVEKNCGISGRVLGSESEENLAQKLIERLQRVQ
ncbi:MAG: hypothetical protein L0099_00770 [Acidobacteria bacterium]|nr:hypothetical protein [Acidobacteriota bacterium]